MSECRTILQISFWYKFRIKWIKHLSKEEDLDKVENKIM